MDIEREDWWASFYFIWYLHDRRRASFLEPPGLLHTCEPLERRGLPWLPIACRYSPVALTDQLWEAHHPLPTSCPASVPTDPRPSLHRPHLLAINYSKAPVKKWETQAVTPVLMPPA